ncbi:MAG: FAD-dependent oxidoreductase [Proteobacteria bacterium]|jgi:monoamine oxidase|nr:FAD-dependent oxidoreductase [Pseudomonadota bacterium]
MKKTRREFLHDLSLLSLASFPLVSGCASLDRLFLGDHRNERNKVVILGSGICGLRVASILKKQNIPFRVYEASDRFGGRVQSLRDFNPAGAVAELGAELISASDEKVLALAKELRVSTSSQIKKRLFYFADFENLSRDQLDREAAGLLKVFNRLQQECYGASVVKLRTENREQFPRAVLFDGLNAQQLVKRLEVQFSPIQKRIIQEVAQFSCGVKLEQVSALHLIHLMTEAHPLLQKRKIQIEGGLINLVESLYLRVAGVIPDRFVRFRQKLTRIEKQSDGFKLSFQTAEGESYITARWIVSTLPFPVLRTIPGWESAVTSNQDRQWVQNQQFGSHGKATLSFASKSWNGKNSLAESSVWSEPGGPLMTELPVSARVTRGALSYQWSGEAGSQVGPHSVDQAVEILSRWSPGAQFENNYTMRNWQKNPFSLGSKSYFEPGQMSRTPSTCKSKEFFLAGEQAGVNMVGTLSAALESAEVAAQWAQTQLIAGNKT